MARCNPFLLIAFLVLLPLSAWCDSSDVAPTSWKKNISLDASVARTRMSDYRPCNQDISFNVGYRNFIATARFTRNGYHSFVNSWMLGYRYEYAGRYSITASAGLSDVAFRKLNVPYSENIVAANYSKLPGFCGQIEAAFRIHIRNRPTPIGVTAGYAYHYNDFQSFSLYGVGLKLYLLPHRKMELKKAAQAEEEKSIRKNPVEAGLPRNIIRTKLLFGIYSGTFIEYERKAGKFCAWSVGLAAKYNVNKFLAEMLLGADAFLKGGEVNGGFYLRYPRPRGWVTLGVKAAYRHREGAHFYAYQFGTYRPMSRVSDDIVAANKIAFTWVTRTKINFELAGSAGICWSYQKSVYHGYYPSYTHWLTQTSLTTEGWEKRLYFNLGLNIGFGW